MRGLEDNFDNTVVRIAMREEGEQWVSVQSSYLTSPTTAPNRPLYY